MIALLGDNGLYKMSPLKDALRSNRRQMRALSQLCLPPDIPVLGDTTPISILYSNGSLHGYKWKYGIQVIVTTN